MGWDLIGVNRFNSIQFSPTQYSQIQRSLIQFDSTQSEAL
jgi:hypothetical protein